MSASIEAPLGELRLRYAALPAFPDAPGERMWYDRMRSFDGFVSTAPAFVDWMLGAYEFDVAKCQRQFPALFTLAFDACGATPPPARSSTRPPEPGGRGRS